MAALFVCREFLHPFFHQGNNGIVGNPETAKSCLLYFSQNSGLDEDSFCPICTGEFFADGRFPSILEFAFLNVIATFKIAEGCCFLLPVCFRPRGPPFIGNI